MRGAMALLRRDDPVEWYCRIIATGQAFGPITGRDLKSLAEQGQVSPRDMVASSPEGPWYPAAQVRGLFANTQAVPAPTGPTTNEVPANPLASPVVSSPAMAAPSPYAAPIPLPVSPGVKTEADSKDAIALEIRRKKLLQKQRRRKLIQLLVVLFLVANAALLVAVFRPRGGSSPIATSTPGRTTGDQASQKLKPLDTQDLDSLLPNSGKSGASPNSGTSDLAATAAAFGGSLRKLSDQIGSIRIVIDKIEQGYPELRQGNTRAWPPTPVVVLTLTITNTGGEAVNYRGWKGRPESAYLSLSPDGPPISRLRNFPATIEVVGSAGPSRLAPGDSLQDVVLFTDPDRQAETWYCTLAGDPVGVTGKQFQFIIPAQDVVEMPIPPELAKRLGRTGEPGNPETASGDEGAIGPARENTEPQLPENEQKTFGNEPIPIPGVKTDAAEGDGGSL
ncbi:hypothetical protein [Thermopirellula anaerolimosa]